MGSSRAVVSENDREAALERFHGLPASFSSALTSTLNVQSVPARALSPVPRPILAFVPRARPPLGTFRERARRPLGLLSVFFFFIRFSLNLPFLIPIPLWSLFLVRSRPLEYAGPSLREKGPSRVRRVELSFSHRLSSSRPRRDDWPSVVSFAEVEVCSSLSVAGFLQGFLHALKRRD